MLCDVRHLFYYTHAQTQKTAYHLHSRAFRESPHTDWICHSYFSTEKTFGFKKCGTYRAQNRLQTKKPATQHSCNANTLRETRIEPYHMYAFYGAVKMAALRSLLLLLLPYRAFSVDFLHFSGEPLPVFGGPGDCTLSPHFAARLT